MAIRTITARTIAVAMSLASVSQTALGQDHVQTELQKIIAADSAPFSTFGESVSMNGGWLAVGAPGDDEGDGISWDSGAAYVYRLEGQNWELDDKLTSGNWWRSNYGIVVSMGDGRTLVGMRDTMHLHPDPPRMFERDGDPFFCEDNGDCAGVGSGTCLNNFCEGVVWSLESTLSGGNVSTWYGVSQDLEGDLAVVGDSSGATGGGPSGGVVHVFRRDFELGWVEMDEFTSTDIAYEDAFGIAVSMSGDWILAGAPLDSAPGGYSHAGSAYFFLRNDSGTPGDPNDDTWEQVTKVTASDLGAYDYFGRAVAIDGDFAVVGVPRDTDLYAYSGSAYAFRYNGITWVQDGPKLVSSDGIYWAGLGVAVDISGDRIVVGAPGDGCPDECATGAAYLFQRFEDSYACTDDQDCIDVGLSACAGSACQGVVWAETAKLVASDAEAGDHVGRSVSISANWAVVGSPDNDGMTGAAYIYDLISIPGDMNGDGVVNAADLAQLLGAWGACPLPCPPSCPADFNGDCVVNAADLAQLLGNWGP